MIYDLLKDRTVFFLGAGASHTYGFPLGSELHEAIINDFGSELSGLIENLGLNNVQFKKFQENLKYTDHKTIDTFLEHKSNFREIGSYAIAYTILKRENHDSLLKEKGWYYGLYDALNFDDPETSTNKLSIISLNYDRSLEHYLSKKIEYNGSYDLRVVANTKFSRIKFLHPHGMLGKYPNVKYGASPLNLGTLKSAASNIKIVTDKIEDTKQFKTVKQTIINAKNIIFLGFGYDDRLINIYFDGVDLSKKYVTGTTMDISDTIKKKLTKYLNFVVQQSNEVDFCESFLKRLELIDKF